MRDLRAIELKFPSECALCHKELDVGEKGIWNKTAKTIYCLDCFDGLHREDCTCFSCNESGFM